MLAGNAAGRADAAQVTVFDSVGFAVEDYSALRFMRDMADDLGIATSISLIPRLADPKDLFGFLRERAGTLRTRAQAATAAVS